MKHYGALLTGANNTVAEDSSVLTVGNSTAAQGVAATQDSIVIYNLAGPSGATDKAVSAAGLVIVPSAVGRGNTHILGADGREVEIAAIGGNSLNSRETFIPTKGVDADGNDIFVNSIISEEFDTTTPTPSNYDMTGDSATTTTNSNAVGVNIGGNLNVTNNLSVTGNTTITGNLDVTGSTNFRHETISQYSDTFIELNVAQDKTTASLNGTGGLLVEHTFDAGGGNALYGGLRFNGTADSNVGRWEYNLAADVNGDPSVATSTGAVGEWIPFPMGTLTGVQGGNGVTVQTTGTHDGLTASPTNPVIELDLHTTAADRSTLGGLAIVDVTGGTGNNELGIAAGGIVEEMLSATNTPTAGNILSAAADGRFTWVAAGGTGNVNKFTISGTKAAMTTSVTVGTSAISATSGIAAGDQNLQVQVFESVTNGFSQILPESIVISDGTVGSAGDVIITFGVTPADLDYKVVITG